jgi:type I restriction enzyme, S subunit
LINTSIPTLRFLEFSEHYFHVKLAEICDRISDGIHSTPSYNDDGQYFFINGNNLKNGMIHINDSTKRVSADEFHKHKRPLSEKTILLSINGTIGNLAFYNDENVVLGKSACYINVSNQVDKSYIYHVLGTPKVNRHFLSEVTGSTIMNLSLTTIKNLSLLLPSLPEQQKIAAFLSAMDKKIKQLQRKKELLEQYKRGVMQKIFSQEIRFKDNGRAVYPDWECKRVSDFLVERKEYSSKGQGYEHISLTKNGVVPKTERYQRDFLVRDDISKKYKITNFNDICYNPANLKFGVICRNKYGSGIFSPIYVTFEIQKAHIRFVEYLLTSRDFIRKSLRYQEGTVYERMAVKPSDLLSMKVKIPSISEQKDISDFVFRIEKKMESTEVALNMTTEFKKGLLQQMFV